VSALNAVLTAAPRTGQLRAITLLARVGCCCASLGRPPKGADPGLLPPPAHAHRPQVDDAEKQARLGRTG